MIEIFGGYIKESKRIYKRGISNLESLEKKEKGKRFYC